MVDKFTKLQKEKEILAKTKKEESDYFENLMGENKRKLTGKFDDEKSVYENKIQDLNNSLETTKQIQIDKETLNSQLIYEKNNSKSIEEKHEKEKKKNEQLLLEKSKNDKEIKKLSNKILDLEEQKKS